MAESAVDSFLLEKTGDEDSYTITNQSDIADSVSDVTNSMTYMIGGIAGISLLVGGIGIMNIMLVSVTERTKEIGIRKAIGAKKKDILAQFMIESTVLSCMGRCDRNRIKCSNHFWNESVNVSRLYDISRN